tara:strand:- start:4144 stop:4584 length:441 start_codon:yes stop_codon:yes gene_type:complete
MTSIIHGITPSKSTIKSLIDIQDPLITGLRFPFGKKGILFNKSSRNELLKGQMLQLLFTSPGERVMLPSFGLSIKQYLFNPLDSVIIEKIKKDIYKQVRFYIDLAELLKVNVTEIEQTSTSLQGIAIKVILKEKKTNEIIPMEFIL